jgi:hypothetical protein
MDWVCCQEIAGRTMYMDMSRMCRAVDVAVNWSQCKSTYQPLCGVDMEGGCTSETEECMGSRLMLSFVDVQSTPVGSSTCQHQMCSEVPPWLGA